MQPLLVGPRSTGRDRGGNPAIGRPPASLDAAFRRGIRDRDPAAWDRLAVLYHKALCRQARLILPPRDDPENAVGDVWLKALKAAWCYDVRRDPYPWLARICVNTCLNQRRGLLKRLARRLGSEPAAPAPRDALDPAASEVLRRALSRLTARQREVVALRYLFGVSVGEIGRLLRKKPRTVEKRLVRALGRLRVLWPEEEVEARLAKIGTRGR